MTTWVFGDLPEKIVVSGEPSAETPTDASEVGRISPLRAVGDSPSSGAPRSDAPYHSRRLCSPGVTLEDGHVKPPPPPAAPPSPAKRASTASTNSSNSPCRKTSHGCKRFARALCRFDALYAPLGPSDELQETAFANLLRHALPAATLPALTQIDFDTAVRETRERLAGLPSQLGNAPECHPPLATADRHQARPSCRHCARPAPPHAQRFSQLGVPAKPR